MDIIVIVLLIAVLGVGYLIYTGGIEQDTKSPVVKKDEIIEQYQSQLKNILKKHENDKNTQLEQKKLFLQKCSSELSRNIFFDPHEAKEVIQKLAHL